MSKARDELEKMDYVFMHTVFCDESVFHYNVMQLRNKYKEVILELEKHCAEYHDIVESKTIDILELEQQKAELIQMIMGLSANCQYECMIPEILNKYKDGE